MMHTSWGEVLQEYHRNKRRGRMDINDVVKEATRIAHDHGWEDEPRSFGDLIALMHSELSEALEEFRNGRSYQDIYWEGSKPCGIPIELADTIIRIAHFCGAFGVDLDDAIRLKLGYNETREHRHGGKAL